MPSESLRGDNNPRDQHIAGETDMTAYWSRERPVIWAEAIYTFPLGRVWYVPAKMVEPVFSTVVLTARPITLEGCEK